MALLLELEELICDYSVVLVTKVIEKLFQSQITGDVIVWLRWSKLIALRLRKILE